MMISPVLVSSTTSLTSSTKTTQENLNTLYDGTMNKSSNKENICSKTLPMGKYILVGIDIDTTGRRLIDEIVQIAAFTPKDHFEQYIMPYMNLNPAARQRHQVRVISVGFYRMLKSTQTYKIIKSKSEIAALKDFLDWLEALNAKDNISQGIILLHHEERKFIPYMILESLKKYNLLDRFLNTVKSFVNGSNLVRENLDKSLQHLTLRKLSKQLENFKNNKIEENNGKESGSTETVLSLTESPLVEKLKIDGVDIDNECEVFDGNARVRAKLAYKIFLHLSNKDSKDSFGSAHAFDKMFIALQPYAQPIEHDLNELRAQNENLERQNSFRPVFLNYFKTTLYHRVRAVKFRIILAEHRYDLQTLNAIWLEKKRDGIVDILKVIADLRAQEKAELANLFDSYFDPMKSTIKPIVKNNNKNRRRNRRVRNNVRNDSGSAIRSTRNELVAYGDKQNGINNATLPDTTTKSPKNQRGKRGTLYKKNFVKNKSCEVNDPTTQADANDTYNPTLIKKSIAPSINNQTI